METTEIKIEQKFIEQAEFFARGAEVLPGGVMELAKKLQNAEKNNKPLRIKLGMDPSRPDLHLGHTVVMRKIKQFQEAGHKIILLIGGGTAMIGDPSGKSDTRPSLSKEQVDENAKTYFDQMAKVVDITRAEVRNNADWLLPLDLQKMLTLSSKVTVAQLMTRDDFAKRYAEGKPISVHEFFYPLLQAYDSVEIDADIELGGTDQRFNTLLGRDIQSAYGKEDPQMVMLLPLLEGTDGLVKMSKSYPEHCIGICEEPNNMYGKLMSIPDNMILKYYTLLTDVSNSQLKEIEERLKTQNPRDLKMELAFTITEMYNGTDAAKSAQENFIRTVQNKEIPDDIPEKQIEAGKSLLDAVSEFDSNLSRSEIKRLMQSGAVKVDGEKVQDMGYTLTNTKSEYVIQYGKRKFFKGIIK